MKIKIELGDTFWINQDSGLIILIKTSHTKDIFLGAESYLKLSAGLNGLVDITKVYKVGFIENNPDYINDSLLKNHINKLCALQYELNKERHSIGMTLINIPFDIEELPTIVSQIYLYHPNNYNEVMALGHRDFNFIYNYSKKPDKKDEKKECKEEYAIELQLWPKVGGR